MKTLNEVIKAFEWCLNDDNDECDGCPYYSNQETDCHVRNVDALHYLREFQGLSKMWNDKLDKEQANPALTWDELRTMEGKPVWVERCDGDTKGWLLILRTNYDVITCTTKHGNSFYLYKNHYCEKWQAYRKERNVD